MHEKPTELAGRPIPKAVDAWSIKRDGEKKYLSVALADGSEASEFPVAELTVRNIRRTWGAGDYVVQYFKVGKDGQRSPHGSRPLRITKKKKTAAPVAAPTEAGIPKDDPLLRAFQIQDAIDRRSGAQTDRILGFVQAMFTANAQNAQAGAQAQQQQLSAFGDRIGAALESLEERIASLEGGDDDDDEDDDEDNDGGDGEEASGPFRVGQPIGETALAEALNGITKTLAGLAPIAQELAIAKMAEAVSEAKARSEAAQRAQLNGGASGASEPSGEG